jgi:heme A synthase
MGWGIILGILALVTLAFVYRMPTRNRRLVGITVGLGVDILVQALIGFAAQDTGNGVVSWVHLLNSYAIFAMLIMGLGMAMMGSRMGQMGQNPPMTPST